MSRRSAASPSGVPAAQYGSAVGARLLSQEDVALREAEAERWIGIEMAIPAFWWGFQWSKETHGRAWRTYTYGGRVEAVEAVQLGAAAVDAVGRAQVEVDRPPAPAAATGVALGAAPPPLLLLVVARPRRRRRRQPR